MAAVLIGESCEQKTRNRDTFPAHTEEQLHHSPSKSSPQEQFVPTYCFHSFEKQKS